MTNKLNLFKAFLLLFVASVFFVSCEDDDGPVGGLDDPDITLTSPAAVTVGQGEEFTISVSALANEYDLNAISVEQDGSRIDASRIQFDGVAASANPKLLFDDERTSLITDITIDAHTTIGTATYAVVVTDTDGNSSSVTVDVTTEGLPPSIEIIGSGAITVNPGSPAQLNLRALKGTNDLELLGVYEDGEVVDAGRLSFDGNIPDDNPFLIDEQYATGFEGPLFITSSTIPGSHMIDIVLEDNTGLKDTAQYIIVSGAAVDELDDYVILWNASGPNGGGLDLDATTVEEATVSNDSEEAEIIDLGINLDLPAANNWIQKIAPANGTEMRYIIPGQNGVGEDVTFADIQYKGQLELLYDAGVPLQNGQSDVVVEGDMFILSNNGNFYAVHVVTVNPTANDNEDFYQFDLKR